MGRIGASLTGIERMLLNRLNEARAAANLNNLRLATLQRINRPADDPSGFYRLSTFRSDLVSVTATLNNVTSASSMVSKAQLALDQIRTQLETIRAAALEDEDQGLTADERTANQAEIDAAIEAISVLANTDIDGRRLLNGSANFTFNGRDFSQVDDVQVYRLGDRSSQTISGEVTAAATQASLTITGSGGNTTGDATFTLAGSRGSASITVNNGESLDDLADRINAESHQTGVTASVNSDTLTLSSIEYGSDVQVQLSDVDVTSGTLDYSATSASGTDATATINGESLTGDGNRFSFDDDGFRGTIEFAGGFSGTFDAVTVSGDALQFALTTDVGELATLAIPGVQPFRLGGLSGTLDELLTGGAAAGLNDNAPLAVRIVDEALADLTRVEGLVDGFANGVVAASAALHAGLKTNIEDAIDAVNGVDAEEEQLLLAKNQQLIDNAVSGLAVLGQQRASVVALIQQIAGLGG